MPWNRRIFFRVYPTEKVDFDYVKIDFETKKIYVRRLQELQKNANKTEPTYWEFQTDGVFLNSTQEVLYDEVMEGVLEKVVNGYSAIIMSFGQIQSGKTFTTSGLHGTEEEFGLLPRIGSDLLKIKRQAPSNIKISIQLSYVEFYNTYAIDLLQTAPNMIESFKCREVRKIKIETELDVLKCIFIGEGRKNFVDQGGHYLSNVATSVVTFHIIRKDMDLSNPVKVSSRLHVIDMAGNETCSNKSKVLKNPKQIGLANITKSQLEQFVLCLAENVPEKIRIKQRLNTLIYYLDGDFVQENIFRFIGHIKVKTRNLLITVSLLRFSNVLQGLKMKKKQIQFDVNEEVELACLKKKLEDIEKEKHLNSVLLNQDLVSGLNSSRLSHLKHLIQDYLKDGVQEITVLNVADATYVMNQLKDICRGYESDLKRLAEENRILLAQQQSDTSLKRSSQSLHSKLSRKSSKIRSKDSIAKEPQGSSSMVSEKRKTSADEESSQVPEAILPKRKKSIKGSSSALSKSLQSRKKSSNTSIERRESKGSLKSSPEAHMPIPEVIPEKQDMWKKFGNSSAYKERVEEYKQHEKEIRHIFISYVKEVNKLQTCRNAIDKCKRDLINAQTHRKFHIKDEYDDLGMLIETFAEKECQKQLECAQDAMLEQQESLLSSQELLKVYLENRREIIKRMEEEFDQFCVNNYKLPSVDCVSVQSDLAPLTFEISFERPEKALARRKEVPSIPDIPNRAQMVINLQKLMINEQKRWNQIIQKKKRYWKKV